MSSAPTPNRIGSYKVVRQLGAGGMGAVFEALYETIERRVAIKVLLPECARNPELTARFFNEARAVNRINHPSIVQIFDFGHDAGMAFIVMELLEGESLASRLRRLGGRAGLVFTLQIVWQIAGALAAAHAKGIVHRDLKPDNLMLVRDPVAPGGERVKLLDFGIAKLAADARVGQTSSQIIMGTPSYMSPEQCRGASAVDDKSDVYSLGVLLFQMLVGQLPFFAKGPGELIAMHMYKDPPPLADLAPELPEEVCALVHRLLAKDRLLRPTMREVVAALGPMLPSYSVGAPQVSGILSPPGGAAGESEPVHQSTFSRSSGQRLPGRTARLLHLAVAVLASVASTGTAFFFWQRSSQRSARPASEGELTGSLSSSPSNSTVLGHAEPKTASAITQPDEAALPVSQEPGAQNEEGAACEFAEPTGSARELAPAQAPDPRKTLGQRRRKDRKATVRELPAATLPAKLVEAIQRASHGDWDGALYAAQDPTVVEVAPERAWIIIGSAACHMQRTTLASEAYRRVSTAGKDIIRTECEAQDIHWQGIKSAEQERVSALLVTAHEHLFHRRFRAALDTALPLTQTRPAEAWRIVGQAACSLHDSNLATKAREASSSRVQQELDQACDASRLELNHGVYTFRSR